MPFKKGNKLSEEHSAKLSASRLGNKNALGFKHSEETKRLFSLERTGRKNPFYGKQHSDETKKKLREANLGKTASLELRRLRSEFMKGNKNLLGHKHLESTKHKIAETCRANGVYEKLSLLCGDRSPAWKGGISVEPYCEAWLDREYKGSIKARDGHRCSNPFCRGTSSRLCLHHIDYNKKNCSPENLITLCNSCNIIANHNRERHQKFYSEIIMHSKNGKIVRARYIDR